MSEEVKISARQQKKMEKAQNKEQKKTYWVQIRMFPIWLRIILLILIFGVAAAAGLMVGYGVLGDGNPIDAIKWETYQYILDIKDGK
jgi:hypothetical protein